MHFFLVIFLWHFSILLCYFYGILVFLICYFHGIFMLCGGWFFDGNSFTTISNTVLCFYRFLFMHFEVSCLAIGVSLIVLILLRCQSAYLFWYLVFLLIFFYSLQKQAYSNILKFLPPKQENFQIKKSWYFSYFCSKHRLWVLVRTASARRF